MRVVTIILEDGKNTLFDSDGRKVVVTYKNGEAEIYYTIDGYSRAVPSDDAIAEAIHKMGI